MGDTTLELPSKNKENKDLMNAFKEDQSGENAKMTGSNCSAPSPNTLRKRRREDIARKVESRKALITTASSSRLDMSKVHSILSGPRLSWDWKGGSGQSNKQEQDEDDDSCGLIVDFHQDSRSALRTHINKAMSQMASRDISSQVILSSQKGHSDDLKEIIQSKRRLISSFTQGPSTQSTYQDRLNRNEVINSEEPVISMWQETQMVAPTTTQSEDLSSVIEPTQVFIRQESTELVEEEIIIEQEEEQPDDLVEPTQVYVPYQKSAVVDPVKTAVKENVEPPNTFENDSDPSSSDVEGEEGSSESDLSVLVKKEKGMIRDLSFEDWLAERNRRKQQIKNKKKSREAQSFFEAEAEESEDEELGGIMRKSKTDESDDDDSLSSDEDSDLEDLVASAKDEYDLLRKSGKDSSKLAKLHAKWVDQRDLELQKAIEDREFRNRRTIRGLKDLEEGLESGLNRKQRKLKAQQDAYVEKFDSEGNLLAPEYVSDESDYDSMEIDSDEFFDEDEFSDNDTNTIALNEEEIALRKQKKERHLERRKRDREMKLEMMRRRQVLKAKLREDRLLKEKDKREIQAGLGIMNKEDQEVFKLVTRTQGVFGYTQTSGTTTQSTSASSSSQSTPMFSFLGSAAKSDRYFKSRRFSAVSLELE